MMIMVTKVSHLSLTQLEPDIFGQSGITKWRNISLQKLFQDVDSWDLHLDSALFGIRQDIARTTKYSPLQIAYGRPHTLPADVKLKEMETPKEATEDMLKI